MSKNTYIVVEPVTVYNRASQTQRTFEPGEEIEGNLVSDETGKVKALNVDGFEIPIEFVQLVAKNAVWLLAGAGLALLLVIWLVFKWIK